MFPVSYDKTADILKKKMIRLQIYIAGKINPNILVLDIFYFIKIRSIFLTVL